MAGFGLFSSGKDPINLNTQHMDEDGRMQRVERDAFNSWVSTQLRTYHGALAPSLENLTEVVSNCRNRPGMTLTPSLYQMRLCSVSTPFRQRS